jgi:antitoxin (DNA-binding transcriptional repressor) of toxin-antitoxin stability system
MTDHETITATELARNLSEILDRLAVEREEVVTERNHRQVARLVPGPGRLTAMEAMADIIGRYKKTPPRAGRQIAGQAYTASVYQKGIRDPWRS